MPETTPMDSAIEQAAAEAIERAILEWLAPYKQEYRRVPHDRLRDLIAQALSSAGLLKEGKYCVCAGPTSRPTMARGLDRDSIETAAKAYGSLAARKEA
ncbi:hypothetical protein Q0812_13170 [Brevundimonas sp. 2R-24]|uniref:Uncharacterized protein n=1 Tax=Peiella sedimenti TaxID=3061083 RepID=A0ABT8SPF7_9CAUL|nr:hypothetical protein [Caulobacteraceae bacterium XZ-24]